MFRPVLIAALLGAAPALAQTATGQLMLDRRLIDLTQAHARIEAPVPEMRLDGQPERYLSLALFDGAAQPMELRDHDGLRFAAADGRVRGVLIEIEPATGAVIGGTVLMPPEDQPLITDFAGDPPQIRVSELKIEGDRLTGRVETTGQIAAFAAEGQPNPKTYAIQASFTAPLLPAPVLKAVHDGPEATRSAPGQAIIGFVRALGAVDQAAILAALAPDHPGRPFAEANPAELATMFLGGIEPQAMIAGLTRVYEYDGAAIGVIALDDGTVTLPLTLIDGTWRQGSP